MATGEIQLVSNEEGEPTAVIVPIELWREISAERETTYLLASENMRNRLIEAMHRSTGLSIDAVVQKLGV